MGGALVRLAIAAALAVACGDSASAQYRRQIEELPPIFAASVSFGALLSYDESVTPIVTPPPDGPPHRMNRDVGPQPSVTAAVRYGRGIAIYAAGTAAFSGSAELSGTDPLTAAPVSGSDDLGPVYMVSAGASFQPIREALPVRMEVGPALLDMGDGGSYIGLRFSLGFRFVEFRDFGGVFLAWDGFVAGDEDEQSQIEYQLRRGLVQGLRLGLELDF